MIGSSTCTSQVQVLLANLRGLTPQSANTLRFPATQALGGAVCGWFTHAMEGGGLRFADPGLMGALAALLESAQHAPWAVWGPLTPSPPATGGSQRAAAKGAV